MAVNVQPVVDLVRNGHKFVGLSEKSMSRLAELRQFLTVTPSQGNVTDPVTGALSWDDDALIDALYRAVRFNCHSHCAFDTNLLLGVELFRATVATNNIGRPAPFVAHGQPVEEVPGGSPTRRRIEAPPSGGNDEVAQQSSSEEPRKETTYGGMQLFDVPMNLAAVRSAPSAPTSIALLQHGLSDAVVHRCAIQILALPATADAMLLPPCTFGIVSEDILADKPAGRGEWIGVTWRVGTTLPCAAHMIASSVADQPLLVGAAGHCFIHVGDVITLEFRPRAAPLAASAAVASPNAKYAALLEEQRKALDLVEHRVSVDCVVLVNGIMIGEMRDVQRHQPVAPSNRYRATGHESAEDPKGAVKRHAKYFGGCRFAVQLCPGAAVAAYDLSL